MRIGITGASGLIGSKIAEKLSRESQHSIKGLHVSGYVPENLKNANIEWIQADIRDEGVLELFVKDLDLVIHCAAIVSFKKKDIPSMYEINVDSTRTLVDLLIDSKTKLIHISSIAVLGRKDGATLIDEEVFWNDNLPHSAYAHTKFLAEMEVHRGIAEGLNAMIFLPSIVLCNSDRDSSSAAIWKQIKRIPWIAPEGANGFVDVDDLTSYILAGVHNWKENERMIINGHNVSYKKLYEISLGKLTKKTKVRTLNPFILKLLVPLVNLGLAVVGKKSSLSFEAVETTSKSFSFDNTKSIDLYGNLYTPLDQSIHKYLGS